MSLEGAVETNEGCGSPVEDATMSSFAFPAKLNTWVTPGPGSSPGALNAPGNALFYAWHT